MEETKLDTKDPDDSSDEEDDTLEFQARRLLRRDDLSSLLKYERRYLKNNRLHAFLNGYKELDNILNVFFVTYQDLRRSSRNCAVLWVAAMETRFQMSNGMSYLAEQNRYLRYEYKSLRMTELDDHLGPMKNLVAMMVQYLVAFNKYDDTWSFLRCGFLRRLRKRLYKEVRAANEAWCGFLADAYEVGKHTAKAAMDNLARSKLQARKALHDQEPDDPIKKPNNNALHKALAMELKNPKRDDDFLELRTLTIAAEDAYEVWNEGIFSYHKDIKGLGTLFHDDIAYLKHQKKMKNKRWSDLIDKANGFLKSNVKDEILKEDRTIWPHQKGLSMIGPFELLKFDDANSFIKVQHDEEGITYRLSDLAWHVDGLKVFKDVIGRVVNAGETNPDEKIRKGLNLHKDATSYKFFFPLKANAESDDINKGVAMANNYSPLHALCYFGGFAYYDKDNRLLEVKALTQGDDLFFDGPYYIKEDDTFDHLAGNGSPLVPITKEHGIADIHPEKFTYVSKDSRDILLDSRYHLKSNFTGAFAYDYAPNDLDKPTRNYFQILTFKQLGTKFERNSNTPILDNCNYLYQKFKADWMEGLSTVLDDDFPQQHDPSHAWHIAKKKKKTKKKKNEDARKQKREKLAMGKEHEGLKSASMLQMGSLDLSL